MFTFVRKIVCFFLFNFSGFVCNALWQGVYVTIDGCGFLIVSNMKYMDGKLDGNINWMKNWMEMDAIGVWNEKLDELWWKKKWMKIWFKGWMEDERW